MAKDAAAFSHMGLKSTLETDAIYNLLGIPEFIEKINPYLLFVINAGFFKIVTFFLRWEISKPDLPPKKLSCS